MSSGSSSRKAGQPQVYNEDRRKLLPKLSSAEALCSLDLHQSCCTSSVESRELRVRPAPGIPSPREGGLQAPPKRNQAVLNSSIISKQSWAQAERLHYPGKPAASHEAQGSAAKSSGKAECKLRHSISITARLILTSCRQQRILTQTQS